MSNISLKAKADSLHLLIRLMKRRVDKDLAVATMYVITIYIKARIIK